MSAFTPIYLRPISTNQIYYWNHFNLHFTYSLQVICSCSHQLTIYEKKFKCINICSISMIIIQFIFWLQCEIHQRPVQILQFFCILFLTLLNKAELILATQSKLLFKSIYLKLAAEGLCFQISFVRNASKLLTFSSHTTVDWKH